MAKKKQPAKFEPVVEEPEEAAEDEEEVTCPVCGKAVGLDVMTCPNCGAEFEAEEVEEIVEEEPAEVPQRAAPHVEEKAVEEEAVGEDEMAECPVCGNSVSLSVPACPYCGAEFEEEEVEEVIEVEEEPAPVPAARPRAAPVIQEVEEVEVEEVVEEEAAEPEYPEIERTPIEPPSSITDLRVIGISLVVLGIIGSQISFFIDWYWTWVPPIKSHLGTFVAIPAVIIVVGLLVFMLVKKMGTEGKSFPKMMPGMSLSLFMFGILALILVMLWSPINNALQDSKVGVGGAFVAVLVVGVLVMFMGQKMALKTAA